MEGSTLIWWESKIQEEIKNHSKISISWNDFITAIKRQFYPLAHMQKAIMNWKNLKELKGQNVQDYTQEFRRRDLMLGVDLQSQDTLLKYIGGLHIYLRHTIHMFNPTNLEDVCVQATYLEARGKNVQEEGKKKPFQSGEKGNKSKRNLKKNAFVKKEGERPMCKNCSKEGHDEAHCWKLHPELRPKKFNNKGKEKANVVVQQDLVSDSGDETKIATTITKGKFVVKTSKEEFVAITSATNNSNNASNEEKRIELFHIRFISKHTKIDM